MAVGESSSTGQETARTPKECIDRALPILRVEKLYKQSVGSTRKNKAVLEESPGETEPESRPKLYMGNTQQQRVV
jgi:hypothetical protein